VVIGPVIGSLIDSSDGVLCPRKVAEQLHNLYSESFSSQRVGKKSLEVKPLNTK